MSTLSRAQSVVLGAYPHEAGTSDATGVPVHVPSDAWGRPEFAPVVSPRSIVTPTISGALQANKQYGDGTNELRYLRATLNAADDAIAGFRLLNGFPNTLMMLADRVYTFESNEAITRLDVACIGDAVGSAANGNPVDEAGTEAEMIANMVTYVFDSADDVRRVVITLSQFYSAAAAVATATNFVMAQVVGVSYTKGG